jgi:hypothetical protein
LDDTLIDVKTKKKELDNLYKELEALLKRQNVLNDEKSKAWKHSLELHQNIDRIAMKMKNKKLEISIAAKNLQSTYKSLVAKVYC